MSGSARFNAVVGVKDETQGPLRVIGARFAALAQQTGLSRLSTSFAAMSQAVGGVASSMTRMAAPIATIGGVAATAGMVRLATGAASTGDDLSDLSEATGVSIRDLQAWGDAAQRAGADQQTLASSIQRLNRGMREAATGGNADLAEMFRLLGISLRDSSGQIRSASDVLPDLAEAFRVNEDPTLRTTMAIAAFGRAGTALIPMLAAGRRELREQGERWRRYGFDFTAVARQMAVAQGQFDNFGAAMRGLGDAIGARLAPVFGPLAQQMADWIAVNREWIAIGIGKWFDDVAASLRAFFAERGPLDRLEDFRDSVGATVQALGGWRKVLIGFGALAALPFVAAVATIVGAMASVLKVVASVAVAMGASSPLGLAILALAGSAYLIYDNWEPVSAFFRGLWDTITGIFQSAWERIRPIAAAIGAAGAVLTGGSSPTGPVASPEAQQQRRENWRNRGVTRIENYDEGDAPTLPLINGRLPMLSDLVSSSASGFARGEVDMVVRFENAPPGTRIETVTRGNVPGEVRTDVGYSLPAVR